VLYIALLSGRVGFVNRNVVCGLLMECLQDVSFIVLVLPFFAVCYLACNILMFLL
jgi:hypothetical protein